MSLRGSTPTVFNSFEDKFDYGIPASNTNPDYDACIKDFGLFQMTISPKHPFTCIRVKEVFDKFCSQMPRIFIYVVPMDLYETYRYQVPLSADKKKTLSAAYHHCYQFVLGLDIDENAFQSDYFSDLPHY